MAYGLQVIGTSGTTQIDGTYGLFSIIASGTHVAGAAFPYPDKVVAVRPTGVMNGQNLYSWGSSVFGNSNFDYIVLDYSSADLNSGYGLKVINPGGSNVYDSSKKYFSITDSFSTYVQPKGIGSDQGIASFTPSVVNLSAAPVGKRYYILPHGWVSFYAYTQQFGDRKCIGVKFLSETQIQFYEQIFSQAGVVGAVWRTITGSLYVHSGFVDL